MNDLANSLADDSPETLQDWYDDNRARFNARTEIIEETVDGDLPTENISFDGFNKKHDFYRKTATEVWCRHCPSRWTDLGEWTIQDGNIRKIRDRAV